MTALLTLALLLLAPARADEPADAPVADAPAADAPAADAPAADAPADAPAAELGLPPLHGPQFRYGELGLFPRTFASMAAIPVGMGQWRARGWLGMAGVMVPVAALMAPTDPSPDARLEHWLLANDEGVPDVWAMEMQYVLWPALAVGTMGTWGLAELNDWPEVAEGMSLTVESVAVTQVYHLGMKMLIGRQGPEHGDPPLGLVLGPTASFGLFPAGTPSGHAGTLFAMLGATQAFFRPPPLVTVVTHGLTGSLVAMHVVNHRHFASDSLWGSALGYAVGVWVVQHRSSRFRYTGDGYRPLRLDRTPVTARLGPVVIDGAMGIGVGGTW